MRSHRREAEAYQSIMASASVILPLSMRAPSMAAVYGNSSALVEPFRIREGEGAALVLKKGSAWGLFEAGITFSLESARELSRSETIYVS